jgi:hypothetical protein
MAAASAGGNQLHLALPELLLLPFLLLPLLLLMLPLLLLMLLMLLLSFPLLLLLLPPLLTFWVEVDVEESQLRVL